MKAITIEGFGSELRLAEVPKPSPSSTEAQIQVMYAGVNPVDWKIREGHLKNWLHHEFPLIPGWDVAGIVTEVGERVEGIQPGDEVMAYCRKAVVQHGAYAEYVCVDYHHLAKKPTALSFAQAAATPLTALTAWQALFTFCQIEANQSLLVQAGAGGVGSFAIQFAKNLGCTVFATASAQNHAYLKELGVDFPIDYTEEPFEEVVLRHCPNGVDAVLDAVGGQTLLESLDCVKPGGCLASIVDPIPENLGKNRNVKTGFVFVQPNGPQLQQIADLMAQGKIKAPFVQELPLKNADRALDKSRMGHVRGKLVLKVTPA